MQTASKREESTHNAFRIGDIMSDAITTETATLSATLHLAPQHLEAFKAVGKERGTFTDWEGRYATLPDLRELGLAFTVLGFWKLTAFGLQAYEQLFGCAPA